MKKKNSSATATFAPESTALPTPASPVPASVWLCSLNGAEYQTLRSSLIGIAATSLQHGENELSQELTDRFLEKCLSGRGKVPLVSTPGEFITYAARWIHWRAHDCFRHRNLDRSYAAITAQDLQGSWKPRIPSVSRDELLTHPALTGNDRILIGYLLMELSQSRIAQLMDYTDQPSVCKAVKSLYGKIRGIPELQP
jgi:hypothetical protein